MGRIICPNCGEGNPSTGILTMCRKCRHPLRPAQPDSVPPPELPYAPLDRPAPGPRSLPEVEPSAWEPPPDVGDDVEAELPAQPLVPPPRRVPVGLRLVVFGSGVPALIGWFFLGFGMIFVWVFGPRHLPLYAWAWAGPPASATGITGGSRATNMHENDSPVYEVTYAFVTPDGTEHHGVSYVTGQSVPSGSPVAVAYVPRRPEVAQIRGMRRNVLPEWVILLVAIFPAIGLAFVVGTVRHGIKANRLLACGRLAEGALASKQPTATRINSREVHKLTFDFEAGDGRHYQATARTHEPERLEDERREPLLYDAVHPAYSVMLDSLPGAPTIDRFGQLEAPPLGRVIASMLLPGLAIVGHGTYLLIRLFH